MRISPHHNGLHCWSETNEAKTQLVFNCILKVTRDCLAAAASQNTAWDDSDELIVQGDVITKGVAALLEEQRKFPELHFLCKIKYTSPEALKKSCYSAIKMAPNIFTKV
mmetsp:Transcript_29697/g.76694  ORF Transcript_29697/g.76694 Transcript_29697/m.76694 type:complete len:109 (-) Transcript_29697:155-481(-)